MLWDLIYEFFIKYVFGGVYRGQVYNRFLMPFYNSSYEYTNDYLSTTQITGITFTGLGGTSYSLCFGNYLSLIATIISMVTIVILCCFFIKKIYNICAHVIG